MPFPDSESRRQNNHEPPKSEIPNRKKTQTLPRPFLQNRILAQAKSQRLSIASEFFTDDQMCTSSITNLLSGGWPDLPFRAVHYPSIALRRKFTASGFLTTVCCLTEGFAPRMDIDDRRQRSSRISFVTRNPADFGLPRGIQNPNCSERGRSI
jgi:hypothetical protein